MHPTLFKIGSFSISSYGLFLAIAMMVGIYVAKRRAKAEGIKPQEVESLSFWIIISAILGARFLYTFVEHADFYWRHPLKFFAFREGGLSFFGGLFFAIATSIWFCRKRRISFWSMADTITPSIALGLAIAKIGCFLAGCCYGGQCDLPWAVTFNHPETLAEPKGVPLHPAQLYESLANCIIFLGLLGFRRFKKFPGEIFLAFLVTYALVRSLLEILRGDPGHLGTLTTAQFLSIPMGAFGLVFWFLRRRALKRRDPA